MNPAILLSSLLLLAVAQYAGAADTEPFVPQAYGVYVSSTNGQVPLLAGADGDEKRIWEVASERARELPPHAVITIFDRTVDSTTAIADDTIKLQMWDLTVPRPPQYKAIALTIEPIRDHREMVLARPKAPLERGIYHLQFSGRIYLFGVNLGTHADFWQAMVEKHPGSWQAHNHLGAAKFGVRDFDGALAHFLKAVELEPGLCEVQNNAGLAYVAKGQPEKALDHYKKALAAYDEEPAIHANYASALLAAKKYEPAVSEYQLTLRMVQEHSLKTQAEKNRYALPLLISLAGAQMELRRFKDAADTCEKLLEIDPKNAESRRLLERARREEAQ